MAMDVAMEGKKKKEKATSRLGNRAGVNSKVISFVLPP